MSRACKNQLNGSQFGRLLVIGPNARRTASGDLIWDVRCACGNELMIVGKSLLSGASRSCGCLRQEVSRNSAFLKNRSNGRFACGEVA